ncbi:MAG: nuclease-related domain-containing protein [Planctomycetota bacterium]
MIIKQAQQRPATDPKAKAGAEAEERMAFYLHRDFADSDGLFILNDLRLEDTEQPGPDGRPGVCQIDHLALHRHGAFIIESKSVNDAVTVRSDGDGGDEWTRSYRGREHGFPSPVQQARRQGEFLRAFLQRHRADLLGKIDRGFRTIAKLIHGSDQRGFRDMPIQLVVAVSDSGKIRRPDKWTPPEHPFRTYVSKSDLVGDKIRAELKRHRDAAKLLSDTDKHYGIWSMKAQEVQVVAAFLAEHHTPRANPPARARTPATAPRPQPRPEPVQRKAAQPAPAPSAPEALERVPPARQTPRTEARCKKCDSEDLTAKWGRYGYYWHCLACNTNTAMPTTCAACGEVGQRGKGVRISKTGQRYHRVCESCGAEQLIWEEPTQSAPAR